MRRNVKQKYAILVLFAAIAVLSQNGFCGGRADASAVAPVPVEFNIPQLNVADALLIFAEQSGERIIFRYDDARDIPARKISGFYQPVKALAKILENTGLKAFRNPEGTIVIRKEYDYKPVTAVPKKRPGEKKHNPSMIAGKADISRSPLRRTEDLVITGSRIRRTELSTPNLVSTIGRETIRRTGTTNIEELLNKLPQIVSSLTGNSNNPGNGLATVDLRGLGTQRTLVLVNGRRYVPSAPSGIIDLNSIPTFLIDKIEVATGGTSAVYGSDAIAGVVNIKLRDNFDGFEGLVRTRLSKFGDGDKYDANLVYGRAFNDERGRAFLHLGFMERDALLQGDRDFSSFALIDSYIRPGSADSRFGFGDFLSRDEGGVPGLIKSGSPIIAGGRVLGVSARGPHPGIERFGPAGQALDFNDATDLFNFAPDNFLQIPQKRLMATFGLEYQLTDRVEFFNQVMFSQNKVDTELAPTPFRIDNLEIPVENPFLQENARAAFRGIDWYGTGEIWQARDGSGNLLFDNRGNPVQARQALGSVNGVLTALWAADGSPVAAVGATTKNNAGNLLFLGDGRAEIPVLLRRMTEFGPRQVKNNRRTLNVVVGLQGEVIQGWDFYLHYNYSNYKNSVRDVNGISLARFRKAADIILLDGEYVCRDQTARDEGCVAANIFGEGNLSPEAIDYLLTQRENKTRYTRQDAVGYISGTIDHGVGDGVKMLLGADWRREDSFSEGDAVNFADPASGFASFIAANGRYDVWGIFSEIRLPVLENISAFQELELSGALRYSRYSLTGSVWTAGGGINWRPFSDLRLRGQYQRAVRAPNIEDLFLQSSESFPFVFDPCAAGNIDFFGDISAICVSNGVPAAQVGVFEQLLDQVSSLTSGNVNLDVEQSDTFTAGMIYQPSFIPEIQVTVDYYHILIAKEISLFRNGVQGIINSCFRPDNSLGQSCGSIFRNPDGRLNHINVDLTNMGRTVTSGVDGQLFFRKSLAQGIFGGNEYLELVFQGSYLIKHDLQPVIEEDIVNCAGFFAGSCNIPLPKFRFTQMATWGNDIVEFSLRWRHIGRVVNKNPFGRDVAVPEIAAKNYFDLYLQYRLSGNVVIRSGVDNIFDITPDFIGSGQQQANTFPTIYDVLGSYYHFGVNVYF